MSLRALQLTLLVVAVAAVVVMADLFSIGSESVAWRWCWPARG